MAHAPLVQRCGWVSDDPLYLRYHDHEWGVPSHDETHLFEMLILEGAQAGLSWLTILKKRENYRAAFAGFDADRVARFGAARIEQLLADPGIVRNRAKVNAAVVNAQAVRRIRDEHGSLAGFLWRHVDGVPVTNHWRSYRDAPVATAQSAAMSKALLGYGCKFVGPTICQSLMQASGMFNDHEVGCFRHPQMKREEC